MEKHSPGPCLDDLAYAADGRHNLAIYLVALLLYRHNGIAGDDDTMGGTCNTLGVKLACALALHET
jgi:hypothetical protein